MAEKQKVDPTAIQAELDKVKSDCQTLQEKCIELERYRAARVGPITMSIAIDPRTKTVSLAMPTVARDAVIPVLEMLRAGLQVASETVNNQLTDCIVNAALAQKEAEQAAQKALEAEKTPAPSDALSTAEE